MCISISEYQRVNDRCHMLTTPSPFLAPPSIQFCTEIITYLFLNEDMISHNSHKPEILWHISSIILLFPKKKEVNKIYMQQ